MGTHTVTGTVTGAYILVSASNTLSVTATGYIEGGVYAFESAVYHVDNYGRISNTSSITQSGVYLEDGGVVVNGSPAGGAATIQGAYDGVLIKSSTNLVGAVTNFGSIRGGRYGIYLVNGNVTNGSDSDTTATVSAPGVASGEKGAAVDCVAPGSSVFNYGSILQLGAEAARGAVYLRDGGAVTNGARHDTNALIEGSSGVTVDGATGVVLNQGAIEGLYFYGVQLTAGGRVTNGALNDRTALIEGYDIGVAFTTSAGTVTNFGTIEGRGAAAGAPAVLLADGGVVTNGAAGDRVATIDGLSGLLITTAAGTLTNFGSIVGSGGATQYGVKMTLGGELTNGAPGDAAAVIQGYQSVVVTGGAGAVTNFGSILGTGGADAYVISITGGGSVTNGSYGDEGALIAGYKGIWIAGGAGTVSNFGSINGAVSGVALVAGGVVSNGSFEDRTAVIDGGVVIQGGAGSVLNFGTILAGFGTGVNIFAAGVSVTNGSALDKTALIDGYNGVRSLYGGSIANYGTIAADGVNAAYTKGGELTNGSAGDTTAVIEAYLAVELISGATLTNWGTVVAQGIYALKANYGAASTVDAEAGSVFGGVVDMAAGTLQAVGGVATIGGVQTSGMVSGAGTLALDAGTSKLATGATLTVAQIAVSGAATVVDAEVASLTYAGTWLQSGGTLDVFTSDKMTFTGAGDSFAGTVSGAGSVVWSGGSDTFGGLTLSATSQTVTNATLTLSGDVTLTGNLSVTSPNLIIAAGGATIAGSGEFILSSNATNAVYGADAWATLTVNGKFYGAGQLGDGEMTLIIGTGGFVDGYTTTALTINTGANTIFNAGTIFAIGSGGTFVDSAVDNTGKLYADGGTLTLNGAVTGTGMGDITGGTLFAASSFAQNVAFTASTTGTLELADSQTYTGEVSGFSLTGATALDLNDIDFINGTTKATYSGTATSGALTVTDGTHTAHITLEGNYTTSTFTVSSDGHGGTKVVDPTKAPAGGQAPATAHPLIAAMASVGANDHASMAVTPEPWRALTATLAGPRAALT